MAKINLDTSVMQDGGQFYHSEGGLIADYGDEYGASIEKAIEARFLFFRDYPEYSYKVLGE